MTSFGDVHDLLLARSRPRNSLASVTGEPRDWELRVPTEFTHEEIAQMIGSSREAVTRLLSEMERKDLIRIEDAGDSQPDRIASDRCLKDLSPGQTSRLHVRPFFVLSSR